MIQRLRIWGARHQSLWLLLLLFVSFRLLALLLFRPGGFIADASDIDFYYVWGQTTAMGYRVYDNLWTAYPPLFPAVMLTVFELSSRIPPWIEPRLIFHTLFGLVLLLFECGNLVLIYRLAGKLKQCQVAGNERLEGEPAARGAGNATTLDLWHPAVLYALLFPPVFTLLGWFEAMPLFFMLLGLDLLLSRSSPWPSSGWIGSAVVAALGFLTKLTPILLVPIAVRWLGSRLSVDAARREWFNRNSPGNLLRPVIYILVFAGVVIGVGYPFVRANPALALTSFQVQSIRPPWESVWALIDGYTSWGNVELDPRNLLGLSRGPYPSRVPWRLVSVAFVGIYLWLYTRRYDWARTRTPVAFAASSVILLFLYSKGWSPQFVVWILAFIVLLLPTWRGVWTAIALGAINFVEAYVFLLLLPDQVWILWATVLLRTVLLLLLLAEFLGQIWPRAVLGAQLRRWSTAATWLVLIAAALGGIASAPRAAQAYRDARWATLPCRETVSYLQSQSEWPNHRIVSEQMDVWRDFYPWLHTAYDIHVVDVYSPVDEPPAEVAAERLTELAADGEFWWVQMAGAETTSGGSVSSAAPFFARPDVHVLDERSLDACTVARVVQAAESAVHATVETAGGPILLKQMSTGTARSGTDLHLVLYWQAVAPVAESYTVFTQLLDESGTPVAQQDNLPVEGLAPTDTWQPGTLIRDPYRLSIPASAVPGTYQLWVGMYNGDGRRPVTLPDGTTEDHLALPVTVAE